MLREKIIAAYVAGDPPQQIADRFRAECPTLNGRRVSDLCRRSKARARREEVVTAVAVVRSESISEVLGEFRREFAGELRSMLRAEVAELKSDQARLSEIEYDDAGSASQAMRAKLLLSQRRDATFSISETPQQPVGQPFPFDFMSRLCPESLKRKTSPENAPPPVLPWRGEPVRVVEAETDAP